MDNIYYECYKHNIFHLIKQYGYTYQWYKIDECVFYNYTKHKSSDFEDLKDPFLLEYKNAKHKLGEDILNRGMYTPFFYCINEEGEKVLLLGKHRLFSLLKYNRQIAPIDKKFLFVQIPNNPQKVTEAKRKIQQYTQPLYFFDLKGELKLEIPNTEHRVDFILLCTGDSLSRLIYGKDITPFKGFNDEVEFEKFLSGRKYTYTTKGD